MTKQILVISDPEVEVGFNVLCDYCNEVQNVVGKDVVVLPMWPHGKVDLIGDKRKMKLTIKELKEAIEELEVDLNE